MKKKYALIFAFLLTGLIMSTIYIFSLLSTPPEFSIVTRVIDGDTLVLESGETIRLLNINSPEKSDPDYKIAYNYLKEFENKSVIVQKEGIDKYFRTLARVYSADSEYINLKIVSLGLAKKFLVDSSELSDFAKAEKNAIENSLGIWAKSTNYGCFTSEIREKEEFVILKTSCEAVKGRIFIIADESRKRFKFTFPDSSVIGVYTGNGENTKNEIYWNSKTNIWNNDRDTLYLFDEENRIAHYSSYGY